MGVNQFRVFKKQAGAEHLLLDSAHSITHVRPSIQGKGKHLDVVETEQPQLSETGSTVSYPSQDPSVVGEFLCISSVDLWIMGETINSVSSIRRHTGAEYFAS